MTSSQVSTEDLDLAASLVREAGLLASRMLDAGISDHHVTAGKNWVTVADRAVEAMLVERVAEHRPHDGVIGEEGADRIGERTWYLDPIDGTHNFVSGTDLWCTALALVDDSGPLLGAVYRPATDQLWLGGRGRPATCNAVPLPILAEQPLGEQSLATYIPPRQLGGDHQTDLGPLFSAISAASVLRILGSASIELAYVASGAIGVSLHRDTSPWDWYPGAALVLSSGGVAEVFEHGGQRWHVAGDRRAVADARAAVTAS